MTANIQQKSNIEVREASSLQRLQMDWIKIKDHFVVTVGPSSGQGQVFGDLLVLADAQFAPHSKFPQHPHKDMEILTWVAQGTLQHYDNNGTDQSVPELSLQLMSARDGIYHAEGNATEKPLRMFQIWIQPLAKGGEPVVQQVPLAGQGFQLLAAAERAPLLLRQNVDFYAAKIESQKEAEIIIPDGKIAYGISIGHLIWNGTILEDGDGIIASSGLVSVQGQGQALIIIQNKKI